MRDLFFTIVVGIIGMIVALFALVLGTIAAAMLLVLDLAFKALPFIIAGAVLFALWYYIVQPLV